MGGTNIRVGLLDDNGVIQSEQKELTTPEAGPECIIDKLKHMIDSSKKNYPVQGIGVGMPGPLDSIRGIVMNPVNLPGWDNIPLAKMLTDYFKIPCFIENDCNVAALAEAIAGAGKGYPIVFYITVSTGVGGGLCIDRRIFTGATGNAGEIANIIIRDNEVQHSYLNPGSLEGMASGTGILRMAQDKGLNVQHTHEVFSLASIGNKTAMEITETALDSLARGMAAIAHIIDPHIFVLGGGVSTSVPDFIIKVREKFEQYIYQVMRGKIRVELAELTDPGMIGAMYMVKNRMESGIL